MQVLKTLLLAVLKETPNIPMTDTEKSAAIRKKRKTNLGPSKQTNEDIKIFRVLFSYANVK